MQHTIAQNLKSIVSLSINEERLKYQLLQSQINPHFLYNILGTIRTCQALGKLDIADQMLTNLTAFYRLTLRKSKELIPIKDELEIARLYLEMEKLCHKDNLNWEINAEDGIENFTICKFTLQPFLENSILHGLSADTPEVFISIQVLYGDDTVVISIEDNGAGMSPETLEQLRYAIDNKVKKPMFIVENGLGAVDTVEPDAELAAKYEERYAQFKQIYPTVKELFGKLK